MNITTEQANNLFVSPQTEPPVQQYRLARLSLQTEPPAEWLAHLPYILAEMPLPEKTALLLSILRVFDAADVEMAACVADEYEISLK